MADKIAANLCKKDDRAFWGEIKKITNSKIKDANPIRFAHQEDTQYYTRV